jgi:hypothetical protein
MSGAERIAISAAIGGTAEAMGGGKSGYRPDIEKKSSNLVTDIWPAGQAKYYGTAPSLKGLSHVFLRHSGVKIYDVAIIYFYTKNGYNAYLRYAFDYEAFKNK